MSPPKTNLSYVGCTSFLLREKLNMHICNSHTTLFQSEQVAVMTRVLS
jgi:hypothetical protein